ncbi:hypothetical protein [Neisseria sp.]|uniref:hypothetical protein n=1 Tax=Neisseria sp. TaxID=192066 RepID=UPI00359FCA12
MSKKLLSFLGICLSITLSLFVFSMIYENTLPKIVEEINNSAIGAILTAIVTVFLLQGQTAQEEQRDKSLKVFEKKQEVYHEFLDKLKEIVQDGKITISRMENGNDGTDELKDLLFQLSYIQMHSNDENTKAIFESVTNLIRKMNHFTVRLKTAHGDRNELIARFYADFSEELFAIVAILKSDLYSTDSKAISKELVQSLLHQCDLYVEGQKLDKYQMQTMFWHELQKRLREKLPEMAIEQQDFTNDVREYYARTRNRHRYFGIQFPIYHTQQGEQVDFKVEIENDLCIGFKRNPNAAYPSENKLVAISQAQYFQGANQHWFGWKNPSRYRLNFWNLNDTAELSGDFVHFNHPQSMQQMVDEMADEIASAVQLFVQQAKEQSL